jgi:hypothetical protein
LIFYEVDSLEKKIQNRRFLTQARIFSLFPEIAKFRVCAAFIRRARIVFLEFKGKNKRLKINRLKICFAFEFLFDIRREGQIDRFYHQFDLLVLTIREVKSLPNKSSSA